MDSIANQEPVKNPDFKPPMVIHLSSSSDSDSGIPDDYFDSVVDTGDSAAAAKRPRVSNGEMPLKKPKLEDGILPIGFLDPLPPEDLPVVVIAQPISVLPPAVRRSCKQFWKAGDYDGQSAGDSNSLPGKILIFFFRPIITIRIHIGQFLEGQWCTYNIWQ